MLTSRPLDELLLSFKSFSLLGGALGTWNQPIEVIRVEMQSLAKAAPGAAERPAKPTIMNTLAYVYKEAGIKGLYRGVTPRICLGIWQTVSKPRNRE